jgi:hypothetical protein
MDIIKKQPEIYKLILTILESLKKDSSRYQPKINGLSINSVFDLLHNDPSIILDEIMTWLPNLNHVKTVNEWHRYDITYPDEIENVWKSQNKELGYLYHGSAMRNWYSILRNGIKVCSGTKWMSAGAAYGNGIYLSDLISLSYGYSAQIGDSIIGIYEIYDAANYKKSHNIYVVPDNTKILLRHLLFLPEKSHSLSTMTKMQSTMAEYWKSRVLVKKDTYTKDEKILMRRIQMELNLLENATWNANTKILEFIDSNGKQIKFEIPLNFPFGKPSLYINGQLKPNLEWSPNLRLKDLLN